MSLPCLLLGCVPSQHTERKKARGKKSEVLSGLRRWLPKAILAVVQGLQCTRLSPVSQVAGFLLLSLLATQLGAGEGIKP